MQWTMNNTLATIGIHFPKLRNRAIAIGSVGVYRDYPVSKGCTSPLRPHLDQLHGEPARLNQPLAGGR